MEHHPLGINMNIHTKRDIIFCPLLPQKLLTKKKIKLERIFRGRNGGKGKRVKREEKKRIRKTLHILILFLRLIWALITAKKNREAIQKISKGGHFFTMGIILPQHTNRKGETLQSKF